MIDIRLYGTPTPRYLQMKRQIVESSKAMGVAIHLDEINDVDAFIDEGIQEVPCFKINNEIVTCTDCDDYIDILKKEKNNHTMANTGDIKKILVPVDLTAYSKSIIEYAIKLSMSSEASMHLIHVQHPTPVVTDGAVGVIALNDDEVKRIKEEKLTDLTTDLKRQYPDLQVTSEVQFGLAGNTIIDLSDEYDLIVIAARKNKSRLEKWIGTVANYVLLNSKCPVIAIPPEADLTTMRSMIFGYEEHKGGEEHIDILMRLVNDLDTSLHIVHVKKGEDDQSLNELKEYIRHQHPTAEIFYKEIVSDSVSEGLLDAAHELDSDILCLAKTSKSMWRYIREGNQTEHLLAKADLPLLVLSRV